MLAITDTAIAAQNAVVAAESLGIGSCYIGDIMENCEEQRRLLQLPEYVFPAVMLVFGWPTMQQKQRQKHVFHTVKYSCLEELIGSQFLVMLQTNPLRTAKGNILKTHYNTTDERI